MKHIFEILGFTVYFSNATKTVVLQDHQGGGELSWDKDDIECPTFIRRKLGLI